MIKKIILWILVISWMTVIFAFSAQEATTSKKTSSSLITAVVHFFDTDNSLTKQQIEDIVENMTVIVRKGAHFTAYAFLGLLLALLLGQYNIFGLKQLLLSVFTAFLYACSDEFHQTFVKGRSGELRDVGIDTAGALCGALFIIAITVLIHKRRDLNGLYKKI